jgi:hypothetical protein
MNLRLFYRNVRAGDNLELFLISAISSLLLVRFYLYLSGFPQVGNGTLHIAHMLWGGILMLVAIVMMLSFLGARVQRFSALLGGIGFGVFIDELGKFITRENNYFFRPTIGLIYAIFIVLYLIFNFLGRSEKLSPREYELNALAQFEEAVLQDLDVAEKQRIRELLRSADRRSPVVKRLEALLKELETIPPRKPGLMRKFWARFDGAYAKLVSAGRTNKIIGITFIVEAAVFIVAILSTLFANFNSATDLLHVSDYSDFLLVGQLVSSLVAGFFVVAGALRLPSSRLEAFEMFRRATLVNIFLTEFFIFSRVQFTAIPGLIANLILLAALHYSIEAEKRVAAVSARSS